MHALLRFGHPHLVKWCNSAVFGRSLNSAAASTADLFGTGRPMLCCLLHVALRGHLFADSCFERVSWECWHQPESPKVQRR